MVEYKNCCVGCPHDSIDYGRKPTVVIYCSECGAELKEGDITDEYHLCADCEEALNQMHRW